MAGGKVDPVESLHVIQATLKKVRRQLFLGSGPVYKVWGLVWLVGFVATHLIAHGPLQDVLPEAFISVMWICMTGAAGVYTVRYFKRHPIHSAIRSRFLIGWVVAFTMAAITVASLASLGLAVHGVQFAVFTLFTVAVIYVIAGAILHDNIQMIVGTWLGVANVISMQFGLELYLLAVAVMGGGGFIIAGFIDDRIHRSSGENL